MSRPTKSQNEQKTEIVAFRLRKDECIPLDDMASRAGMRRNQLARHIVMRLGSRITLETARRADPALLTRLDKIGGLLNQLVKNAHIYKNVPSGVEPLCHEIKGLVKAAFEEASKP